MWAGSILGKGQALPAGITGLPRYYPEWGLVALIAIIDHLWLARSRLFFAGSPIDFLAPKYAIVIAILFAALLIGRRLRSDASGFGRLLLSLSHGLAQIAVTGLLILSFGIVGSVFCYLAASLRLPLWDARLAAADAALGFGWIAFLSWCNGHAWIAWILTTAYHSFIFQGIATLLVLSFLQKRDLREYIALFMVSALITTLINAFMPAAGAYVFFAPDPQLYTNLGYKPGIWHLEVFNGLRSGAPFAIDLARIEGIITFPSFHTALAIIIAYAWRHVRFFFWPVAALNICLVVSTVPVGGHYLVDVIAGAVIAGICIATVRWLRVGNIHKLGS